MMLITTTIVVGCRLMDGVPELWDGVEKNVQGGHQMPAIT